MKKISLLTALVCGICYSASAGGYCKTGTAHLSDPDPSGNQVLTCPGNGTCYETDNTGIVAPGHSILIHFGDQRIVAKVMSSEGGSSNPPSDDPGAGLPPVVTVQTNGK